MHKIRGSFIDTNDAELSGVVEVDEVWVGSERKNKQVKRDMPCAAPWPTSTW
ncbi:MAG: hypothetical protein OXD43_08220 [Bacteroidetes bacterium]|nr:hypothetical protein [Bacteroidota bacterium]